MWQVSGRSDITDFEEVVRLDTEYISNWNFGLDMWYVIDADEGASLIYGFQHEVTEEILRKAVETGTLDKHLQKVPVHKGDTYFVPAGTVHGIGKGILVAEIQESSNVTYRVYDYDRVDKNGKKRELHFDKAVQVMNMKAAQDVNQKPRIVKYYSGCSRELLCRCKYFETERIQVTMVFCSTMSLSAAVIILLPVKSRWRPVVLPVGCRIIWNWAILILCVTGVMQKTM